MKLIVLGNYGTFPGKDGACSGYLLQEDGLNILIDCGNGVLSRLQRYCKIEDIDAIVLSHLHRDHTSDMYILKYAVETKIAFGTMKKPIDVYTPSTPKSEYEGLDYKNVFKLHIVHDRMIMFIKGIRFEFIEMKHSIESYGISIEYGGKKLSYSGDTMYNKNIIDLAKNADVFLSEATSTKHMNSIAEIPHLSAEMVARIAVEAEVKRLLLTHFWFEENRENYYKEASAVFPKVELSLEGAEYLI